MSCAWLRRDRQKAGITRTVIGLDVTRLLLVIISLAVSLM